MSAATPIPAEVETVRSFLNTLDVAEGADELVTTNALQRWLQHNGLVGEGVPASGHYLAFALRLRSALRAQLVARPDQADAAAAALDRVLLELPLTAVSGPEGLAPASGGMRGALAQLAVLATTARIRGTWSRLKICQGEACQWAFYDTSRNRSKRWCSTEVCGARPAPGPRRDRLDR